MKKNTIVFIVVLAVIALAVTGCGLLEKQKTGLTVTLTIADPVCSVTGRVVDDGTLQPIADAEVTFIVNGAKHTVYTSNSTDADIAGTFAITNMPAGQNLQYTITKTGYARMRRTVNLWTESDNTPMMVNLGTIMMMKPVTLSVLATDAGVPTAGVTIWARSGTHSWDFFSAVTGADGKATFTELANGDIYMICSRPKTDTSGVFQYLTSCISGSDNDINGNPNSTMWNSTDSSTTVAINLIKPTRNDTIALVGSNKLMIWDNAGTGNGTITFEYTAATTSTANAVNNDFAVRSGQSIMMVYNYPVSLTSDDITVSYMLSLVPSTTTGYGNVFLLSTATGAIDSTGTVVTIANAAGWTPNWLYAIKGTVTAMVSGGIQYVDLASKFYVVDDTANGLSSTTTLIADNYSGSTGTTSAAFTVNVNFPEYVYGTYRVVSKATNSTTQTIVNGVVTTLPAGIITWGTNSLNHAGAPFNTNLPGTANKLVYRVPFTAHSLANNATGTANNITIHFDVSDLEGNAFSKTVTLDIL